MKGSTEEEKFGKHPVIPPPAGGLISESSVG
jgi:hypothetical protein